MARLQIEARAARIEPGPSDRGVRVILIDPEISPQDAHHMIAHFTARDAVGVFGHAAILDAIGEAAAKNHFDFS